MRRRFARGLSAQSISIITLLTIGGGCSSPNREVPSSPEASESGEATDAAPAAPSDATAVPAEAAVPSATTASEVVVKTPVETATVQGQAPTPGETPPPVPVVGETRAGAEDAKPAKTEPESLQTVLDAEQRRITYEETLKRLAAERDAAAEAVVKAEKDALAFKNPFLPRPKLAPDAAEKVKDMDGTARVQWADNRLAEAKAALDVAQKAYDDAKANPPY